LALTIDRFAADLFLDRILTGLPTTPLDLAVSDARAAVRGMNYSKPGQEYSSLDWWVPVLYARASGFDLIARADLEPALQAPPPLLQHTRLGLNAPVLQPAVFGLDATADEPISIGAMMSEVKRRLATLLFPPPTRGFPK
jgi:hypothetical protein